MLTKKNNKPHRFLELDALRGIAALMVVFFHLTMGRPEAKLGFKLGTTGVDLFFIISGFVIFMSIKKVKSGKDFVINRISRLYPAYWAAVTSVFVLLLLPSIYKHAYLDYGQLLKYYLGNLTMFQFYLNIPNLDEPYWTLIVEMLFYIVIILLYTFNLLKYVIRVGIVASIAVVTANNFFGHHYIFRELMRDIPLLGFVPLFLSGIVFYKIYTVKQRLPEKYTVIIFCLINQILLYKYAGRSAGFISQFEYAAMLTVYFTLFTLFVNNKLQFITSEATVFLGQISYSLYLIHQYISISLLHKLNTELHLNFWVTSLLIVLPVVILMASLVTYFIEVPFGKFLKKRLHAIFQTRQIQLR